MILGASGARTGTHRVNGQWRSVPEQSARERTKQIGAQRDMLGMCPRLTLLALAPCVLPFFGIWLCSPAHPWTMLAGCLMPHAPRTFRRRTRAATNLSPGDDGSSVHWRSKPAWVRRKVLRLAVHVGSCRVVADTFNRIHGAHMTVGKSWVHGLCKAHAAELLALRRKLRNRTPRSIAVNAVWALDLTFLTTPEGPMQTVLGIVDHGTRVIVRLEHLPRKCTWTLLGKLCLAIAAHGTPGSIRTDNESMFTSHLWARAFRWMGIRHQRSEPGCPRQNGRIERLFGTLKPLLKNYQPTAATLQRALDEFAWFYNHVRVHQNLCGLTPAEAWRGETTADVRRRAGQGHWVSALNGLLVGYHLRR
jgi:putative transposase